MLAGFNAVGAHTAAGLGRLHVLHRRASRSASDSTSRWPTRWRSPSGKLTGRSPGRSSTPRRRPTRCARSRAKLARRRRARRSDRRRRQRPADAGRGRRRVAYRAKPVVRARATLRDRPLRTGRRAEPFRVAQVRLGQRRAQERDDVPDREHDEHQPGQDDAGERCPPMRPLTRDNPAACTDARHE